MSASTEQPSLFGSTPAMPPARAARATRATRTKAARKSAPVVAAVAHTPAPSASVGDADESFEVWFAAHRDPDSRVPGYEHSMFVTWAARHLLASRRAAVVEASDAA